MCASTRWALCVFASVPVTLAMGNPSGLVSDDFNTCDLDRSIWTVTDPVGSSNVQVTGMGTQDARLVISIPAGASHDIWTAGNRAVRVMQPANNADFDVQVKYDSVPSRAYQMQGLLVEQDEGRFIRYDLINDGSNTFLFAATISGGSAVVRGSRPIEVVAPFWLSIERTAHKWTLRHSPDGQNWAVFTEFQFALSAAKAGLFAGNWAAGDAPQVMVEVDYFLNTAKPFAGEDGPAGGPTTTLSTAIVGDGTISVEPAKAAYNCGEQVAVSAVPAAGWQFGSWSGDLQGTDPTQTLHMFLHRSIQANFERIPLQVSAVAVQPSNNKALVTWTTNTVSTGTLRFGLTPEHELGELHSDVFQTSHSAEITGLLASSTYHYSITCTDEAGQSVVTPDAMFTTARELISDDFRETSINTGLWTVVNPSEQATFRTTGSGTRNARLEVSVPAGVSHDAWTEGINSPWLKQEVGDQDFGLEIKLDSGMSQAWQAAGVIVQEDHDSFLRVDFYFEADSIYLFVGAMDNGASRVIKVMEVPGKPPYYMRLIRTGSQWRALYSKDGRNWVAASNFTHEMTVKAVGPFISNQGSPPPAFTAWFDYIFNLDSPIIAEDGFEPDLTPPAISNVRIVPQQTGIAVSWDTDEPADSSVLFGRTSSYELGSVFSDELVTSHNLSVTGLSPLTAYNVRIVSTDEGGNESVSDNIIVTTTGNVSGGPVINVWYGDTQQFGHIGTPIPMVNVLGNVSGPSPISSLSYSLNGGAYRSLNMGPNTMRLAEKGDFNVEVPFASLWGGGNSIAIRARDNAGRETVRTVTVNNSSGPVWPVPYSVNWGGSINSAAQVTDGIWRLEGNGVRTSVMAFDRLIAVGDRQWQNYEVSCPITVHSVDSNGYPPPSYGPGVGLVLHWPGHSNDGGQPWQGIYPLGAIGMFRWTTTYERFQLFGNNGRILASTQNEHLQLGVRYIFKMRVQNGASAAQYWFKWWRDGQAEPSGWQLSANQSYNDDPGHGCILLLAHHVDATFGAVTITP